MSLCGRNRVVVLILALVVGGAGGYFAHVAFRSGPAEVREPTQRVREVHPVPARRTARRPVAESAELKELRERVMSLEAEFDEVTGAADEGRKENLPGKDAGAGGKSEDVVTSAEVRAKCKTYGDWKRQYPKHWEKDHGNMSLDVFPGFMYDSKPNGYRKLSFLWRLFRYEDEPENGVSADFLFVPLCRPVLR